MTQPIPTPTHCPFDGVPITGTRSYFGVDPEDGWPTYVPCGHPAPVDRRVEDRDVALINHAQNIALGIERRDVQRTEVGAS